MTDPMFIAALPSGEAAFINDGSQVVKINNTGHTVKVIYDCNSCSNLGGLLLLGDNLCVVHDNGTISEIQPHTGEVFNVYQIPDADYILHYGSLSSDPSILNTDILLLSDADTLEVFSYNLTSGEKQVHVTGIDYPTFVSYIFLNGSTHYIVNEFEKNMIHIYNSSWGIESKFGGTGSGDGEFKETYAAIVSSNNSILVSDYFNHRVSVFTSKGEFLHHLLKNELNYPEALSYFEPYLWVTHYIESKDIRGLYRYRLDH